MAVKRLCVCMRACVRDFWVKVSCPLKNGEYHVRVYQFTPKDKKVLQDTENDNSDNAASMPRGNLA